MATRSSINLKKNDGSVIGVYCHWDGYPENNGKILKEYYTSEEIIEELISMGDMSSLGTKIHPEKDKPHTIEHPQENVCAFYYRERNESWNSIKYRKFKTFKDACAYFNSCFCEYHYLYENGKWYYCESIGVLKEL